METNWCRTAALRGYVEHQPRQPRAHSSERLSVERRCLLPLRRLTSQTPIPHGIGLAGPSRLAVTTIGCSVHAGASRTHGSLVVGSLWSSSNVVLSSRASSSRHSWASLTGTTLTTLAPPRRSVIGTSIMATCVGDASTLSRWA
eukprot:114734-Pyramimonas_sp.AAC.1